MQMVTGWDWRKERLKVKQRQREIGRGMQMDWQRGIRRLKGWLKGWLRGWLRARLMLMVMSKG